MRCKYDSVYYIGEQDMYVPRDEKGKFKSYDSPGDAYTDTDEVMRKLTPSHVVFNGKAGALTGKNALTANVGENVLIVHSQANRDSRPHLIGGHGDYVWETGKFSNPPETGLETWFIRGGSAGAALYKFLQPGIYAYVTHNLIEAAELGATAHFKVEGKWNDDLMTQVKAPAEIPTPEAITSSSNKTDDEAEGAGASRPPCPQTESNDKRNFHADRLQTQAGHGLRRRPCRSAGDDAAAHRSRVARQIFARSAGDMELLPAPCPTAWPAISPAPAGGGSPDAVGALRKAAFDHEASGQRRRLSALCQ